MRFSLIGRGIVLAAALVACGFAPGDDAESSADAITAAQASTELGAIISHPETNLRGVGDLVIRIEGEKDTWSFYPYKPNTTIASASTVADDHEAVFLILANNGAVFLFDLKTGAGAAAAPKGVSVKQMAVRLRDDMSSQKSKVGSVHPNGLPIEGLVDGLADSAVEFLTSAAEKVAGKIADSTIVQTVVAATKDSAAKVVGYFTRSEEEGALTAVTETAPKKTTGTPDPIPTTTTPEVTPPEVTPPAEVPAETPIETPADKPIEVKPNVVMNGPAEVARAVVKLAEATEDGVVQLEAAATETAPSVSLRNEDNIPVIAERTEGPITQSAEEGAKLVRDDPKSVWMPGVEKPEEVLPLMNEPPADVHVVMRADTAVKVDPVEVPVETKPIDTPVETKPVEPPVETKTAETIWVAPAKTVEKMAEAKVDPPIGPKDPVIETRSDGAVRNVESAANRFVVKIDKMTIELPDAKFLESPFVKALDAAAKRDAEGLPLPKIELVTEGAEKVTESALSKLLGRAETLLKPLGVTVNEGAVRKVIEGVVPDSMNAQQPASKPDAGSAPTTKPDAGTKSTKTTQPPTPEFKDDNGDDKDAGADMGPATKAHTKDSGCSAAPGAPLEGGEIPLLAFALIAAFRRRQRRQG